jgi:hypothetical protein
MHHYNNTSVNSPYDHMMPTYDGYDYYIPPFHNLILVPCNSADPEHIVPSLSSCQLLTRTGVQKAEKTPLLLVYIIDNTTDVGLLLKHGDLLGAYYTGPHAHIVAERTYMLIGHYNKFIEDQKNYFLNIESAAREYFENNNNNNNYETIENDDPTTDDDLVLMSLHKESVYDMPAMENLNIE